MNISDISVRSSATGERQLSFGDCSFVITSMEIERDAKNGDTVVISYDVQGELSETELPTLGGTTNLLSGVTLSKVNATTADGGITTIKLTFTTPEDDEEDEDDEDDSNLSADDPDDGSGNDSSATEGATSGKYSYKCSLDVTLSDEPLLTHPKLGNVSGAQLEYVKAFMDGARAWEKVPVLDSDGKPQTDKKGRVKTKTLGSLLSGGGKLVELAKKGVTSYKAPMATFSESYVSKSGSCDTSGVGQVGTPGGAPKFKGRNWLLVSRNSTLNEDGKTHTISSVWMLSGAGGWDEDLYGA